MDNDNQGRGLDYDIYEQRVVDLLILIFAVGVLLCGIIATLWEHLA